MAVFRYKMQGILDIKEKLEDKAKQEFAEANMRLDAEKKKLDEFHARKLYYMQEGVKLRTELIDVRKIRENKMAVLKMDEYSRYSYNTRTSWHRKNDSHYCHNRTLE